MSLFVGLDFSTQQVKLVAVNDDLEVKFEQAVHFDNDLPHYKTSGGVHQNGLVATAPTLLWVEALDLLFARLQAAGFPFSQVKAISGSGQQHGSVYFADGAIQTLKSLDAKKTLKEQLENSFSYKDSPIWMDSSTGKQCEMLQNSVGGAQKLADITGSSAYERFTGNQIAKLREENPAAYEKTERISLVSSFAATLMLGDYAPIDSSDGSGMNMLNIRTQTWDEHILQVVGGSQLAEKLGSVAHWDAVLGHISPYFIGRYGFSKDCVITVFTGDNPATLSSMGTVDGDVVISLGTSDTLFLTTAAPKPALDGHIFCHPTEEGSYMAMLCYKNGSLTRESIRDQYTDGTWETFNSIVESTAAGCNGQTGFYFKVPEITPHASGIFKFKDGKQVAEFDDPKVNCRAVLESQFLSMRLHAQQLGVVPKRVMVTGGASANPVIVQLISDVFGVEVYKSVVGANAASLGPAFKARFGYKAYAKEGEKVFFDPKNPGAKHATPDIGYDAELSLKGKGSGNIVVASKPNGDKSLVYTSLVDTYSKLEAEACVLGKY
ncbi:hypothetical protein HK098_000175 [Nowakowskiella sp. JEL0407]|nr:hypothetical protein HK098_000175 [Nowakowskiella sp. JEL0407]